MTWRPETPARVLRLAMALVVLSLLVGSCSSDGQMAAPPGGTPSPAAQTEADDVMEGMFDVGGHDLYLNCAGTGTPTVMYLHGSIEDPGVVPHGNGLALQRRLKDDHRFCVYDRRNLGRSDTVDAVQTVDDALTDLDNLITAAQVDGPYVLLGASFGGVLAYLYANRHPDDVVGMVHLDSMFPDELGLEDRFPEEERYEAFHEEDEQEGLERISHFGVMQAAADHIGEEPDIPFIYLASEPDRRDEPHVPGYNEEIYELLEQYVNRFSPGGIVWVDAPHFMEPSAPDEIESALREVIDLAR
jgi:hypothetical protein